MRAAALVLVGAVVAVVAVAAALAVTAGGEDGGRAARGAAPWRAATPAAPERGAVAPHPRGPVRESASRPAAARRIVAGRSAGGRVIAATRRGRVDARVRVLVVGSVHGTETAGHAVVRRLRRDVVRAGVAVWTVRSANPDGAARRTRQNARGVDLNRNFPTRWRPGGGRPFESYFAGSGAGSEPETRALMRLVRRLRPDVTVHFHQALALVNRSAGVDRAVVRRYASVARLPARTLPRYRGTAAEWQNTVLPGTSTFAVELPAGALSPAAVRRHAAAVLAVARAAG